MAEASRISYAIEQRLRLFEFLLAQYGYVNRSALTDFFGISTPQASLDIRAYLERAPGNACYDPRAKTYCRTPNFQRIWP